jgi:hypothetical protein
MTVVFYCLITRRWRNLEMSGKTFGALVRREHEAKEIGLREMARMIGFGPTYLSNVERGEFPPPAEEG